MRYVPRPMSDTAAPATVAPELPVKQSWYRRLYLKVEGYASTPYAMAAFIVVSIIDASFFPVPPFAIMVPMVLAQPKKWWRLAAIGTVASIGGGLIGYFGGAGLVELMGWGPRLAEPMRGRIVEFVGVSGMTIGQVLGKNFWFLALAASVLPSPFKIVAIGSGIANVPLPMFLLAAAIGRSVRFFAVGGFLAFFGPRARKWLRV